MLPVIMATFASSFGEFRKMFPALSCTRYVIGNEKEIQDRKNAFKEITRN